MDLTRRLRDKVCIVTGSGGRIGRATSLRMAAEGALIVGCDIANEAAAETQSQVESSGGRMISIHPADMTDPCQCLRVVDAAVREFGHVDVLFNNAANGAVAWIEEMSDADWHSTINQELDLVFLMTRAAWPELVKSRGAIINMASVSAWMGLQLLPGLAHSAAKGGVLSMTRHLAMEGRSAGIRVNSVSPGTIENSHTAFMIDDPTWKEIHLGRAMLSRLGQPEEVAGVIAFLASEDASFITGTDIAIDGGMRAW